jgi:hypothetical protein
MQASRQEFCEQIVSKFNKNASRSRRKAFVFRNLFGCGGLQASIPLILPFSIPLTAVA